MSILKTLYNLYKASLHPLRVRSLEDYTALGDSLIIKPVLPGWTTPLSDLPAFILSFLAVQTFHEAGHAVAAVCENVDIVSTGVALGFPFIPGAFVALSQQNLSNISLRSHARIICAGAFHNFLLALLLSVVAYVFNGQLYEYVGDYGRAVTSVSKGSELYGYIHPNTIITSIDALTFSVEAPKNEADIDIWDRYLLSPIDQKEIASRPYAWAVDKEAFDSPASNKSCCLAGNLGEPINTAACFIPYQTSSLTSEQACFEPSEVMLQDTTDCRDLDEEKSICVRPHPWSHIVRVGYLGAQNEEESILLQSSKRYMWENLKVSQYTQKHPLLFPDWFVNFFSTITQYIIVLSVTFGLVNMLPIPLLDGSELVQVGLQTSNLRLFHRRVPRDDLIELEVGRTSSQAYKHDSIEKHTTRLLNAFTLSLLVFALGGSVLLQFIDSTV
ncbi:peptidase M50 [Wallemia mellicola]|nr:peptidase M50 [Wallemia mellicola]